MTSICCYDRIPNSHSEIVIEEFNIEFSCVENPTNQNLREYLQFFDAKNIKLLVKTTSVPYDEKFFVNRGIQLESLTFIGYSTEDQKDSLTYDQIKKFIQILRRAKAQKYNIAIQSISGRSRPVMLIACAIIVELGKSYQQAIEMINSQQNDKKWQWNTTPDQIQFMQGLEKAKLKVENENDKHK